VKAINRKFHWRRDEGPAPYLRPENALRRRAQALLRKAPALPPEGLAATKLPELVRELQLSRIELEMQNEELLQTEAAAQEALHKYSQLFDFAPVGYVRLDKCGLIREANVAAAALLGIERNRLTERPFAKHVAKSSQATFAEFCSRLRQTRAKQCCELMLVYKNTQAFAEVRVEGKVTTDPERGEGLWLVLTNISEYKQSEATLRQAHQQLESQVTERTAHLKLASEYLVGESASRREAEESLRQIEERYRLMVSSIMDYAIVMLSPSGEVVSWNEGADRIQGYREEEILGRHFSCFYTSEDVQSHKPEDSLRAATESGRFEDEGWRVRKDGTLFWAEVVITALRDAKGGLSGYAKITRDISTRNKAELELAQHREVLEELVRLRTAELETANTHLQAEILERKQAEAALKQAHQRWSLAMESAQMGTWDIDLPSGVMTHSAQIGPMFGQAREFVHRDLRAWSEMIHPDDREQFLAQLQAAIDGPSEFHAQFRVLWQDGAAIRWVETIGTVLRDDSGHPLRAIGVAIDITERQGAEQALRESEMRFRAMAETVPDVIYTCRPDGQCEYINHRFYELTGLPDGAAAGFGWMTPIHTLDADVKMRWSEAAHSKSQWSATLRIRSAGGQYRWFLSKAVPIFHPAGRIAQWFGTLTDIHSMMETEEALKASQTELRQLNHELEQRVLERTEELRALAVELTQTEERERRRLAQVLHDDLQQLLFGAKLHLDRVRGRLKDRAFQKQIGRVEGLLTESVELSRSLAHQLSPPVLHDLGLAAALKWLGRLMKDKHGLTVELALDEKATPDDSSIRLLLLQSVRELLFNAIKHAGVPRAHVELKKLDDEQVQIVVSDEGAGFNPAQLKSSAKGFGLSSIRERLQLFGGRFGIKSFPGRGSQFTLTVPSHTSPGRSAPAAVVTAGVMPIPPGREILRTPREATDREKIQVLLVDDHAIVREGLLLLLEAQADIAVVGLASDGQEAVALARQLQPQVLVMDISMPRLNGIEATRQIIASLPEIRVIGLSMSEDPERKEEMRAAGAVTCLSKGGSPRALVAAIRKAVAAQLELDQIVDSD